MSDKFKSKNKQSEHSSFIRYCLSIAGCLIVFSVFFVFIVFGTNTLYRESGDEYNKFAAISKISLKSVINDLEDDENQPPNQPTAPGVNWQPTGTWYSEVPPELQKAGSVVDSHTMFNGDVINIYNGLPWDAEDDTYIYDAVKAAEDTVAYINATAGKDSGLGTETVFARERTDTTINEGVSFELKGVRCLSFAPPPSVWDPGYCNNFTSEYWYKQAENTSVNSGHIKSSTPRRFCIMLQPKSGDTNIYYVPLCVRDTKGHTWPGGTMQTNCQVVGGTQDGPWNLIIGDTTGLTPTWTMLDFVNALDTVKGEVKYDSMLRGYVRINCEIYRASVEDKNFFSNYKILGWVCWWD